MANIYSKVRSDFYVEPHFLGSLYDSLVFTLPPSQCESVEWVSLLHHGETQTLKAVFGILDGSP